MLQRHLLNHLFPIGACGAIILSWTIRGAGAFSDQQARARTERGNSDGSGFGGQELVNSCMESG
jgi:hypothetical protein